MTLPKLVAFMLKQLVLHRALTTTTEKLLPIVGKPDTQLADEDILTLLSNEIGSYDQVYLVLDALDESPGDMSSLICPYILANFPPNLSLLCTSRRIQAIIDTFTDIRVQVLDLSTQIQARDDDMRMYVDTFFSEGLDPTKSFRNLIARAKYQGKQLDKETLTVRVLERARGMCAYTRWFPALTTTLFRFLLLRLIMERLKSQGTPRKLTESLESLPNDLFEMYTSTIERSADPGHTVRLFCWVFLAWRPLSPLELLHAAAWTQSDTNQALDDQDLGAEETLLASCGGLMEVQNEKDQERETQVMFTRQSISLSCCFST